ncbi:MAG: isochorismatase family cysteine hydrolase [Candidatus Atabeyarchaeum deiterrae]
MKYALLVVDMLNDFIKKGAPLEVPLGRRIVNSIKGLLEKAREVGVPVVCLCDRHLPSDPEFKVWPKHTVAGTEGSNVIFELSPKGGEFIIPKRRYSGFFGTDLDLTLSELNVDTLIITGVLTNICVLYTTVDASARGYDVIIPQDSVAALTEENQKWALKNMEEVTKVQIAASADIEEMLSR